MMTVEVRINLHRLYRITARNTSGLADVSNYAIEVEDSTAEGEPVTRKYFIRKHNRNEGALVLLQRIIETDLSLHPARS